MKEKLAKLLEDRRFYMVISLILAIMYWMVLSMADDSTIEKTFYNVPVQLDYNSSVYKGFGLDIIGDERVTVDVTVAGPRNQLNELTADDFLIYLVAPGFNHGSGGSLQGYSAAHMGDTCPRDQAIRSDSQRSRHQIHSLTPAQVP